MYHNRRNNSYPRQSQPEHFHDHTLCGHDHGHTITQEFLCHVPLAIFSLALSFIVAAILKAIVAHSSPDVYENLFHACHYAHLLFASTGTVLSFYRFSHTIDIKALLFGAFVPFLFCNLSDVILPTLGGKLLGMPVSLHLCILHTHEFSTLFVFLLAGICAAVCLTKGSKSTMKSYISSMHFFHIFVSALASLFYLAMHGIDDVAHFGGPLLLILVFSVALPCIFSDSLIPLMLSQSTSLSTNKNNHSHETQQKDTKFTHRGTRE